MSIRNLDKLFKPDSVALIGASDRAGSVGAVVAAQPAARRVPRRVMLVNPHHRLLDGMPVYPDVAQPAAGRPTSRSSRRRPTPCPG